MKRVCRPEKQPGFRMMHGGVSAPSGCAFTHRVAFEEGSVIGFFSRADRGIGGGRPVYYILGQSGLTAAEVEAVLGP